MLAFAIHILYFGQGAPFIDHGERCRMNYFIFETSRRVARIKI